MSQSKEFLKNKLENLYINIDRIKIRYEFRSSVSLHLVEILPLDTYENNQNFILKELEIQEEFEKYFGENEEVLFISSDSLNEIKNCDFKLGYSTTEKFDISDLISHSFSFNDCVQSLTGDFTSYPLAA